MKVLITGGAGYIGSHVVYLFRDNGHDVVILDNLSRGIADLLPKDVCLHVGEVGDDATLDAVLALHRPDAVLHFAGSVVVPESVAEPAKYYRNNTSASLILADACVRHGVKALIFSSTAAVYGLPGSAMVDETTPTCPITPYGWSKLMTEQILMDISRAKGLTVGILRYFNVAGADPLLRAGQSTPEATHLLKVVCEVATGQRDGMAIFGADYDTPDGTCVRDFIHVTDLAAAHLMVCEHILRSRHSVTFNVGNGRGYSVREVIAATEAILGRRLTVFEQGRRTGDPASLVADASAIRRSLDWRPRHTDLQGIISTALAWERLLADRRRVSP